MLLRYALFVSMALHVITAYLIQTLPFSNLGKESITRYVALGPYTPNTLSARFVAVPQSHVAPPEPDRPPTQPTEQTGSIPSLPSIQAITEGPATKPVIPPEGKPLAQSLSDTEFKPLLYYTAKEVSRPALLKEEINLDLGPVEGPLPIPGITPPLIVTLWINESGSVDHVETAPPDYPERIAILARKRFANARFIPAEKDGRVVKSRKKIEAAVMN